MKIIFFILFALSFSVHAENYQDITISIPGSNGKSAISLAKFDKDGEKLFIGMNGSELKNSILYDTKQKNIVNSCISSLVGEFVNLSNDGQEFAIRIKGIKKEDYIYEIRNFKDCSIKLTFKQPKLQYPELPPQFVFNTTSSRGIFVEPMNFGRSGKAWFKSRRELEKAGFSYDPGRVLFFDLKKQIIFKKFPTPSDYTIPYISDDGLTLALVQIFDNESKPIRVFSTIDGRAINLEKYSDLSDLNAADGDLWQFRADFYASTFFNKAAESKIPEVNKKEHIIRFSTNFGDRTIVDKNIYLVTETKFWLPIDEGKYVAAIVSEPESQRQAIRLYTIQAK
ncbi:hypothetical protein [Paraherbaspirillum soli]|uniref:Uncharacterized protein n=1 Tax=Paraherbaspirillum soli TaxID=631222 RepID=A0ABW0M7G4_9BURK